MNLLEIPGDWKYLLAALIGGLCTLMGSCLTQNAQTQRERQKWQAEKLLEYYTYSINELFKLEKLLNDMNIKILRTKRNSEEPMVEPEIPMNSKNNTDIYNLHKEIKEIQEKCNDLQVYLYLIVNTQDQNDSDSAFIKDLVEDGFFDIISVSVLGKNSFKIDLEKGMTVKEIRKILLNIMKKDKRLNQMFKS